MYPVSIMEKQTLCTEVLVQYMCLKANIKATELVVEVLQGDAYRFLFQWAITKKCIFFNFYLKKLLH